MTGECIAVVETRHVSGSPWALLAREECHYLAANLSNPSNPPSEGWVLIDGAAVGLGPLLRPAAPALHPPRKVWDLLHRLYREVACIRRDRICMVGLPAHVRYSRVNNEVALPGQVALPVALQVPAQKAQVSEYLSYWLAEDARETARVLGSDGVDAPKLKAALSPAKATPQQGRPRLAIVVLLRGAPPACVIGWIAYHLGVGFVQHPESNQGHFKLSTAKLTKCPTASSWSLNRLLPCLLCAGHTTHALCSGHTTHVLCTGHAVHVLAM